MTILGNFGTIAGPELRTAGIMLDSEDSVDDYPSTSQPAK